MFYADVAEMPRLIYIAGDPGTAFRIAHDETVAVGVFRQPAARRGAARKKQHGWELLAKGCTLIANVRMGTELAGCFFTVFAA